MPGRESERKPDMIPPVRRQPPASKIGSASDFMRRAVEDANIHALAHTQAVARETQELLGPYRELKWTDATGRIFRGLARFDGATTLASNPLPFSILSAGDYATGDPGPNDIVIFPGILWGDLVAAGVGAGAQEYFPRIDTTALFEFPTLTVPEGNDWRYVVMRLDTEPVVTELYGEFRITGLKLKTEANTSIAPPATITLETAIPTGSQTATINTEDGEITQRGVAFKSLGMVRYRSPTPGTDPALEIIQLSLGNWHLGDCPTTVFDTYKLAIAEPGHYTQSITVEEAP